jgi:hypothetical protein
MCAGCLVQVDIVRKGRGIETAELRGPKYRYACDYRWIDHKIRSRIDPRAVHGKFTHTHAVSELHKQTNKQTNNPSCAIKGYTVDHDHENLPTSPRSGALRAPCSASNQSSITMGFGPVPILSLAPEGLGLSL